MHGIAAVAGLIAGTLGSAGRPAVFRDPAGGEIEASDAETIVACFTPDDPRDRLGTTYVRNLVRDQHAAVPDFAATAAVLAGAMIRQAVAAMEGEADPQGLARGIAATRDRVTDELQRRAADLRAKEEIAAVTAAAVFDRLLAVFAAGVTGATLEALTASRANAAHAALAAWVAGAPYTRTSVLGDLAAVTGATVAGGITAGGPLPALASAAPPVLGSEGEGHRHP